jgi:hypothetical protein
MQLAEQIREVNFFAAVERRHRAPIDRRVHSRVHIGIGVPQNARAHAVVRHVDIAIAVQVPHLRAARLGVITGPLLRQEHLRALGEQLRSARNSGAGLSIQFLTGHSMYAA